MIGEQRSITVEGVKGWYLKVFDPAEAVRIYTDRHGEAPEALGSFTLGGGQAGDPMLRAMAHDRQCGWRRLPVATDETITALEALGPVMPNFKEPLEAIHLASRASLATGLPWQVPAMILNGSPGTGKTRFSKAVSAILGTSVTEIPMSQMNGAGPLTGTDQSWKHPRVGKVAQALVSGETASPCILLDELEKTFSYAGDAPLDVLHQLWEPENARRFTDECLGCQFAAHRVIWMATSNETQDIRESLLDRALVYTIAAPDRTQMEAVIRAIYAELAMEWQGWFTPDIDPAVITRVAASSPRQIKAALRAAMIRAAADGRKGLEIGDCPYPRKDSARWSQVGFIRHWS
ncbi:AAA family ATPase [Rhabdaerophilum sp. SD176]|uniref:AAA family ATPase n=1 Tax=Rhabdaerophilum sp. SD176 TaxID=2983548 RepID=UPI0024DF6F5B|nr:AAA family ATPase [Rhabdaerophilum sp. SD176]